MVNILQGLSDLCSMFTTECDNLKEVSVHLNCYYSYKLHKIMYKIYNFAILHLYKHFVHEWKSQNLRIIIIIVYNNCLSVWVVDLWIVLIKLKWVKYKLENSAPDLEQFLFQERNE